MYILCLRGSYEVILEVLLLLGQYGSFNNINSLLISKRLGGIMQSSSWACVLFHFAHSFWLYYLRKLKVNLVCRINIFYLLNPEDIRSALLRYPLLVSILFLSELTTKWCWFCDFSVNLGHDCITVTAYLSEKELWWIVFIQKQASRGVLWKGVLKICSKFTGERPCRIATSHFTLLKSHFGMGALL